MSEGSSFYGDMSTIPRFELRARLKFYALRLKSNYTEKVLPVRRLNKNCNDGWMLVVAAHIFSEHLTVTRSGGDGATVEATYLLLVGTV